MLPAVPISDTANDDCPNGAVSGIVQVRTLPAVVQSVDVAPMLNVCGARELIVTIAEVAFGETKSGLRLTADVAAGAANVKLSVPLCVPPAGAGTDVEPEGPPPHPAVNSATSMRPVRAFIYHRVLRVSR